ncbi:MAG: hypothetical protein INF43_05890 [Alphaproteobacteria bacterium]|jgi:hypothetical protein|nr:hypothetical protein [Alphaproteobacteria bacterium]
MSVSNCCSASAQATVAPITGVVTDKAKPATAAVKTLAPGQPTAEPALLNVQGQVSLSSQVLATLLNWQG